MSKSQMLTGLSIFAAAAVFASGIALAQDAIATRKALMKAVGGATKASGQMVKGEVPFDAAKAQANMALIAKNAAAFPANFPKGSETGGETHATPAIWANFADFEAKAKKFSADASAAAEASGKGIDAFKAAFGVMAKNCKGCHDDYAKFK